jgi:hypothetical protein
MIIPFDPEHILAIRNHPWQRGSSQTLAHGEALAQGHCAYTALCPRTGRPLVCAGIVPLWPHRAMCWASFDAEARPVMVEAHRRTLREVEAAPFTRLEMYVIPDFVAGIRWAHMLGFVLECWTEAGSPDGRDILTFKRIRRGNALERLKACSPLH